jgi:hypothetical protein
VHGVVTGTLGHSGFILNVVLFLVASFLLCRTAVATRDTPCRERTAS